MDIDQALPTYDAEAQELLGQMEAALLTIENDGANVAEPVNAIFRAVHTIKGSAGLFGFDETVDFTHVLESVLDKVREGSLPMDASLPGLLLEGHDHISKLVRISVDGIAADDVLATEGRNLLDQFRRYLTDDPIAAEDAEPGMDEPIPQLADAQATEGAYWHISLRFGPEVLRNGMDPLSFLRYLQTLGDIVHVTTLHDAMPSASQMDPEVCYLGFEIAFDSTADKQAIEATFEFVKDDCALRILPPRSRIHEYMELIRGLPEDDLRLGEILVRSGSLTQHELELALRAQSTDAETSACSVGEILVQQGMVVRPVVDSALEKQRHNRENRGKETRFIRVEADKLEHLINLVGELVIASAGTALLARKRADSELLESAFTLSRLVEDVRDGALNLRMVQIGETFNRFHRIVRDVSKDISKDIQLVISGGETELDKTVVEHIGDPLTHLVRNAIDHGIESPQARAAAGKPPMGTVGLSAHHDSGTIVIEVTDDGGGLDKDKLLAKALERGLIGPDQKLSEQEAFSLIFEPGFSTAAQVTNLSGRGVGMDVVKRNITALRGSIEIDSQRGSGTTIRIRLPLTLAIIDGFLVNVWGRHYVVPLEMVVECIELPAGAIEGPTGHINLRGKVLPCVRLDHLFEFEPTEDARRESIVVVQAGGRTAGLIVSQLHGEVQTVIKPLSQIFRNLRGIGGTAVLGSGDVALILDVATLLDLSNSIEQKRHTAQPP